MIFKRLTVLVGLLAMTLASATQAAAAAFELKEGDRVLFIGDTFIEREVDYGYLETHLTAAFPDRNVTFRNLGWAGDTPMGRARASFDWNKSEADWLKRVQEQVALVKPTVAFLSYGMTASFEAEAGLPKFKADLAKLMDAIKQTSGGEVRFVLLAPIQQQNERPDSPRSQQLAATAKAIQELATERNAQYVDLLEASRRLAMLRMVSYNNPVTLNEQGYDYIAARLVAALTGNEKQVGEGSQILNTAIRQKNELFFHRWRPANWTYLFGFRKHEQGQNAGEIPKFDPLIEVWEQRIAKLRDLSKQDAATIQEVQKVLQEEEAARRASTAPQKPQPVPTFDVAEGLEVTLWAENPSLHKPIQMNWDAQGRLWVASSEVYPQIRPGQTAVDSIVVLEDTDGDGKADKSTVFAEGLLIPTGILPDNQGGCYVAASHQLLHFQDTNGDGKADVKRIILSSFGTEDTHHNLHTLRWGYDGHLYMNQSIYTHTHVETPHGIARLNSGGIWRYNPQTDRMEIFTKGGCNPWGHHWDQYGNSFFTDGAGFKGVYHAVEGATYFTYADMRRELESVTPGNWPKFCAIEVINSPNFPAEWQGDVITCDFRAHRIVRFKMDENGSTFAGKEMPDVLRTTNVTFRPIDVRMGPDGGLYIADWSNPIIQHGEVDFRDPRRDKEHGRIWRVTAKNRPLAKVQDLTKLSAPELFDRTLSANGWEQEQVRRVLTGRAQLGKDAELRASMTAWADKKGDGRALLEELWLLESLEAVNPARLDKALNHSDARVRVAAARLVAHQHEQLSNALTVLGKLVADENPRVRLEALRALAKISSAQAAELALTVLNKPMDSTLDYALWLTINDLAEPWIAAVQSGAWKTEGREKQLEFALRAIQPAQASRVLTQALGGRPLPRDGKGPWIEVIGSAGSPNELQALYKQVLDGGFDEAASVRALKSLSEASRLRKAKPAGSIVDLGKLFDAATENVRIAALRLAGEWKDLGASFPKVGQIAGAADSSPALRGAALDTLRQIGGPGSVNALVALTAADKDLAVRRSAVGALAVLDLGQAIPRVVEVAKSITDEALAVELWRSVLSIKGANVALREALPEKSLSEATAKAGMRVAREGGRDDLDLVVAFAKAGGLTADTQTLTADLMKELATKAAASGDPVRGEIIYRRADLACLSCHSIGGAGGKVGPDMTSIGASAPADYLVEALMQPSAKIKEGYHAVSVETKDSQEFSGVIVRESPQELVLRNAANQEVSVAKNNIENRQNSTLSLMPSGLLDPLNEQEKLDLIAFLSRLGKPGEFDASKGGVARKWRVYSQTHTDQQNNLGNRVWTVPLADPMWGSTVSLVNGQLTKAILEEASKRQFWSGTLSVFAATELQTTKAGPVSLELDATAGELWIDGKKVGGTGATKVELSAGTHRVLVKLDPKNVPPYIRLKTDASFRLE